MKPLNVVCLPSFKCLASFFNEEKKTLGFIGLALSYIHEVIKLCVIYVAVDV